MKLVGGPCQPQICAFWRKKTGRRKPLPGVALRSANPKAGVQAHPDRRELGVGVGRGGPGRTQSTERCLPEADAQIAAEPSLDSNGRAWDTVPPISSKPKGTARGRPPSPVSGRRIVS